MRRKTEKDTVCVRVDRNDLQAIKELARKTSFEKNNDIYFSDLIREAIKEYLERRKK